MLTQMLVDQGAEVIKVEPPSGEPVRNVGCRQGGESVWFRNTRRGKKSAVLNLRDPGDKARFLRLAATADVLVEAFRPGVADRLGIGPDTCRALNPRLFHCSISGFGQTGPLCDTPAHDLAIEAPAGVVSLNLGADGKPANPHMPVADITGSMTALAAILMALLRRERTGRGDVIDISMQVAAMAWLPNVTGPVFAENRAPVVKEERSFGGYAFLQTCECADGRYVALGGVEHKFVENFLNAVGRLDLIPAACGPNGPGQVPVIAALKALFLTRTRDAWVDRAAGKGLAFAPVLDLREAFAQPQVAARGMLMRDDGSLPRIGSPVKYRDEPGEPDLRLPGLGEHSGDYR